MNILIVITVLLVAIAVVVILKIHDAEEISFKLRKKPPQKEVCARCAQEAEQGLVHTHKH
jgi:hypothetical protein